MFERDRHRFPVSETTKAHSWEVQSKHLFTQLLELIIQGRVQIFPQFLPRTLLKAAYD